MQYARSLIFGFVVMASCTTGALAQTSELMRQRTLIAIILDDTEALRELQDESVNFSTLKVDGRSLISHAAAQGSILAVKFLAAQGSDIDAADADGYTPIMRALEAGYVETAKDMAKMGASLRGITQDGHSVRTLADRMGLANFGPEYNDAPLFALSQEEANQIALAAAEAGDIAAYDFAIDNGAASDVRAANGWTPLMLAGLGGKAEMVAHIVNLRHDPSFGRSTPFSVGGLNALHATLVTTADKSGDAVYNILKILKETKPFTSAFSDPNLRLIVDRSGFTSNHKARLAQFFPYPPLARLDYRLPVGQPETADGWRQVQRVLAIESLYNGKIDGKPGPKTYRALLAYVEPLIGELAENTKVAAERSVMTANLAQKNKSDYAFWGSEHEGRSTWQAGEFNAAIGQHHGYYLGISGPVNRGAMSYGGYYVLRQDFGEASIYAYVWDPEKAKSGNISYLAATFPLFNQKFHVSQSNTGVRLCGIKPVTCIEIPIIKTYSEIPSISDVYAMLHKRKISEEQAIASQKSREEAERVAARKLANEEKEKKLKLASRDDVKLSKADFEELLLNRKLVFDTGSRIQFLSDGTYNVWNKTGKLESNGRYSMEENGNVCALQKNSTKVCNHWVSNKNTVLWVSTHQRSALKQSLTYFKNFAENRKSAETSAPLFAPTLPKFPKLESGDIRLSEQEVTALIIGHLLMSENQNMMFFPKNGKFRISDQFGKKIQDGIYVLNDNGSVCLNAKSQKSKCHYWVKNGESIFFVDDQNRILFRKSFGSPREDFDDFFPQASGGIKL